MLRLPRLLPLLLLFLTAELHAQRTFTFAPYSVPATGTIALAVPEGLPRDGAFAQVDTVTNGAVTRAATAANFRGQRGKQLDLPGVAPYDRILLIGMGSDAVTPRLLADVGGLIGQSGATSRAATIEILWAGNEPDAAAHLALGASLGQYRFGKYQRPTDDAAAGQGQFVIRTPAGADAARAYEASWRPVATAVAFTRDITTEPSNEIYPETFVERARQAFAGLQNVRIEVLDVPAMERLGMGGILSVGKGSLRPPRLLIIHYAGGRKDEAPLAFVGKGITFDSGGVSLKPNDGMWRMKSDMAGAATAVGTVLALAGRRAPVNAVGIAALAENMPSGSASRPGDVIRTMSGRTFEIMSTDAEGRMVLSDAVWYAQQQFKPRVLIDLATLTGAIVTALGDEYAGLFSRSDVLADQLRAAGESSGEEVWRMPLHPSYAKDLESPVADLRNGASGRGAGAGLGAHFIGAWVEEGTTWAHLDIAGVAWRESEGLPTAPKGASAFGVRLLDRYVREYHEPRG